MRNGDTDRTIKIIGEKILKLVVIESWTNRLYRMSQIMEIIYVNKKNHTILQILRRGIFLKENPSD